MTDNTPAPTIWPCLSYSDERAAIDAPEDADQALAQLRNTYDDHRVPLHEERNLHAILADLREARRK